MLGNVPLSGFGVTIIWGYWVKMLYRIRKACCYSDGLETQHCFCMVRKLPTWCNPSIKALLLKCFVVLSPTS